MEGREWVWENGIIREAQIAEYQNSLKKAKRQQLEETKLRVFKDFVLKL